MVNLSLCDCLATLFVNSEPYRRRISFGLFAEFVLSEILQSLLSLRMTGGEGRRVAFLPISKLSQPIYLSPFVVLESSGYILQSARHQQS